MPLGAVGGKADPLEFQLCPPGKDKGAQSMVLSLPGGLLVSLGQLTVCAVSETSAGL